MLWLTPYTSDLFWLIHSVASLHSWWSWSAIYKVVTSVLKEPMKQMLSICKPLMIRHSYLWMIQSWHLWHLYNIFFYCTVTGVRKMACGISLTTKIVRIRITMPQVGVGKLFPKSNLLFYSFILRYWALYSFRDSLLLPRAHAQG